MKRYIHSGKTKDRSPEVVAVVDLARMVSDCLAVELLRQTVLATHKMLIESVFEAELDAATQAGKRPKIEVIVYKSPAEQAASKKNKRRSK